MVLVLTDFNLRDQSARTTDLLPTLLRAFSDGEYRFR